MASPLVSICIPTYNRAGAVKKAIDSALSQSYQNIEVLIVDDASVDDIESVIAEYNDDRLKFFKNSENLGQFGNVNRCIELSRGKYVHILHSDDYIDLTFTENCLRLLETNPNLAMTFSSEQTIMHGQIINSSFSDSNLILKAPDGFRQILLRGNFIPCPSVIVKREIYQNVKKFSLEYPYAGDYYQWLKISQKFDIGFVSNATVFYCQDEKNTITYDFLEKTPLGYLDIVKIFFHIITDLDDDIEFYHNELNIAIRRHMYEYIDIGISDSKLMKSFSPLIFIGFGFNFWTLIGSKSIEDRLRKLKDLLYIFIVGFYLIFPGRRSRIMKVVLMKMIKKWNYHLKSMT